MNSLDKTYDDVTFDKIEKYYTGTGSLTAKEEEICSRWELAFALLLEHKNKKIAISKYAAIVKINHGSKLSPAQCYRDFQAAEKLFLPLKKYSKEFLRLVIIESAMRDIKAAEKKAKDTTNAKEWFLIMDIKNRAEIRIAKAAGLDVNDPNMPDFAKLQFNQISINVDSKLQTMFSKMLSKGVLDVTDIYEQATINENIKLDHRKTEG